MSYTVYRAYPIVSPASVADNDDECHLVQYVHNHVRSRIVDSSYSPQLKHMKFSIDKAYWRNLVGQSCKKNISLYTNKGNMFSSAFSHSRSLIKLTSLIKQHIIYNHCI